MKKQLVLLLVILSLFGCESKSSKNSSFENGKDSLSIIYTKDKWSIVRPKWENSRNFAVTAKIMNYALVTSYKDFIIQVDYKSDSGALLESRTYTLHTSIAPQYVDDFDKSIDDTAPTGTSFHNSTWKLLSVSKYIDTK